jgi:AcrR family transcriptional regulator
MATPRGSAAGGRQRRRPTKRGVILSEQLIIDTAMRVLRRDGAEGLSVRRLGQALGADPTALYRYFSSIEDLKLAIADELIDRALRGSEITGDWKRDLRNFALRAHESYLADPHAAVLAASRVTGRPHEAKIMEQLLGILRTAGFSDEVAAAVYMMMVDLVLAYAALDAAALALPADIRATDVARWRDVYAALPPTDFPNIAAVADRLLAIGGRSSFPMAVDVMLEGMASLLITTG